jgi:hypothetical protein
MEAVYLLLMPLDTRGCIDFADIGLAVPHDGPISPERDIRISGQGRGAGRGYPDPQEDGYHRNRMESLH